MSNYTARGRPQQYGEQASSTIYHSWHVRLRLVLVSVFRSADDRFCLRYAVLLSRNMTSIALWTLRSPRRLLLKLRHCRFPFFIQAVHNSLVNMLHRPITFLHRLFDKKENKISLDRVRIWIALITEQRVDHWVTRTHNMTVLTVVIEHVGLLRYK